jgi:hypothetical protein
VPLSALGRIAYNAPAYPQGVSPSLCYACRTRVIDFQGAWIWVQDKPEIRRHITHMASISNTVMRPRTGDMEANNPGATGI